MSNTAHPVISQNNSHPEGDTYMYNTTILCDYQSTNLSMTNNHSSVSIEVCGANYCPSMQEHINAITKPPADLIYIFFGSLLFLNIIFIVLGLFLPQLQLHPTIRKLNKAKEDSKKRKYCKVSLQAFD